MKRRESSPPGSRQLASLAASTSASYVAYAGMKVLFGWLVLERTSSALLVALVFALLMLPRLLFGLHLGVLLDRIDRRTAAVSAGVLAMAVSLALVPLIGDEDGVAVLLGAAFIIGLLEGLRVIAIQTLVYGAVSPTQATAAMALSNFVGNLGQAVGGLLVGALLESLGTGASLVFIAGAYLAGGVVLIAGKVSGDAIPEAVGSRWRDSVRLPPLTIEDPQGLDGPVSLPATTRGASRAAISRTMSDPKVRLLASIGVVLEVLGFSSTALLPVLARDVYGVGASGLGAMNAIRSVGGAIGLLSLMWAAKRFARLHRGFLLLTLAMAFGIAQAVLGFTDGFPVALAVLFALGVSAASLDALLQTLLQATTSQRGSAMGVWVWTLGFAPIGQIEVGLIATLMGAQITLGVNGIIMTAVCASLMLLPGMRRLR